MLVQDNTWNNWSGHLNSAVTFVQNIQQNVTTTADQLDALKTSYANNEITFAEFQTQAAPIIAEMNAQIKTLNCPAGLDTASFDKLATNLQTQWGATLQTFVPSVPNPSYPLNSSQQYLPVTVNGNGSETVSFSCPFSHGNANLNFENLSFWPNWLPGYWQNDGHWHGYSFAQVCEDADNNQGEPQTLNWAAGQTNNNPAETVTVTIPPNSGEIQISVTISASNVSYFGAAGNPDISALRAFVSNPFGD